MLTAIWNIWLELAPWLLLGAVAAGLLHVLMPPGWMKKHLSGRLGVFKAVAIGVPLPLCSCGVIPVGVGLRKDGASRGAAVGFLISTPQTGVDSLLVSGSLLGWPFAVLKVLVALVTGLAGGLITDLDHASGSGNDLAAAHPPHQATGFWRPLLAHCTKVIESIWGWLLLGVLISAAITWLVPENSLRTLPLLNGPAALLITLVLSLPLYVCATASVPIAAALVSAGLPTGAALVFLMAGPATNVATLGAVSRALGRRALIVYLLTIIAGSLTAGLFFNHFLPNAPTHLMTHEHGPSWWRVASAITLAVLLLRFAVGDVSRWWRRRTTSSSDAQRSFVVTGMTCQGCASRLEKSLVALPDLDQATVSFATGTAVVSGSATEESVLSTIERAGFSATVHSGERPAKAASDSLLPIAE
ncbi:MAG: permease [Planctomycetaceae bacterium]|nr:permease [Planctomycetaceae bacterium]